MTINEAYIIMEEMGHGKTIYQACKSLAEKKEFVHIIKNFDDLCWMADRGFADINLNVCKVEEYMAWSGHKNFVECKNALHDLYVRAQALGLEWSVLEGMEKDYAPTLRYAYRRAGAYKDQFGREFFYMPSAEELAKTYAKILWRFYLHGGRMDTEMYSFMMENKGWER